MKKGELYLTICFTLFSIFLFAQRDIEPTLVFSDTSNYNFTGEWQYLSTEIYLFNGEKFSNLINELDFAKAKPKGGFFRKKGIREEHLEYLFITATLNNVKFFSDKELTYPLYNFQISTDKDNKYQTFVSDNIDHIRIIDNLPLYSTKDFIDADIRVKAITNNDQDQFLNLVSTQLKNISKITNPSAAVLSIIGEFGNFLDANTRKKEYHFSSTIRLFEQKNFDTRVHSIKVYALTTANSKTVEMNTKPLADLLDTINHTSINKPFLKSYINYNEYPLVVVVNYKSLYNMEEVTGDEVNFASIEKRKLKIETDYKTGLINAETYRQEKDYINFLTVFANLKNHLEVYSLNYKSGNTDAIGNSLFRLMQYYRQLLKTDEEIKYKYRGNSTYQNIFSKEYESILGYASLYFDGDHNLQQLKGLVKTLLSLETTPNITTNSSLESTISALRFSDVFKTDLMNQSMEGQLIQSHLNRLEGQLFQNVFENEITNVNEAIADAKTKEATAKLKEMVRNTSCGLCRSKGLDAIRDFDLRMDEYNRQQALILHDSLTRVLQPWIFIQFEKLQLIRTNFNTVYTPDNQTEHSNYLLSKLNEADRDLNNLKDFIKIDLSSKEISIIQNMDSKLEKLKQNVTESLNFICNLKPELCSTNPKSNEILINQKQEVQEQIIIKVDSVMNNH